MTLRGSFCGFRRFRSWLATGAIASAVLTLAPTAEAQVLRFSKTAAGAIASTGNTLGLAKASNSNGPGTSNSIGTFIALDPNAVDDMPVSSASPWGKGTTADWTKNGSTGNLAVPAGAEVLYAELVWGGSYNYGGETLSAAQLNTPVTITANGDSITVMPDSATAVTVAEQSMAGFAANYYLRSGEVTEFINKHRGAMYTVSGVPGTQNEKINSLNAAGWQLVAAYRYSKLPVLRNLSIFVGGSFVDEDSEQDYTLEGFCAPGSGPVEGRVTISALEGDADLVGDQLLIGATQNGDFVKLSGVNNPEDNFFCSQVNGADGQIDTTGSFGDKNHDAFGGKNLSGGRQGWDTTTIPLSDAAGHLSNGQTSAVIRTITTGDSYMPTMVAMELDVKSPDFTDSQTKANKSQVQIGDTFEVTATLSNTGEAAASALTFKLPAEVGVELVDYATEGVAGDANGKTVTGKDLAVGVPAGKIEPGETRTITMRFEVTGAPENGTEFVFEPQWDHSFVVCAGDLPMSDTHTPPSANVSYFVQQDEGTGGGGGTAPVPLPLPPIQEEAGCGCSVPGQAMPSGGLAAMAAGVLGLVWRRRRSGRAS